MQLVKNHWCKQDIIELKKYLESLGNPDKVKWTQNINCTGLECLAIPMPKLKAISKDICKGNFISFLNFNTYDTFELVVISGYILNTITDFDLLKEYLLKYKNFVECWATCDILKFQTKYFEQSLFELAMEFCHSKETFTRRIGLKILFSYTQNEKYIDKIYQTLNCFTDEKEYYVNMIVAWLFCEMFIKNRDRTYDFLKTHKLNKFSINKGISKCRDSFRVSKADKDNLLNYRL